MPPAKHDTSPELDIVVDSIGRPYQAGDVITGRIVRHAHVVCPMAIVEVSLLGRTKARLSIARSAGQVIYVVYYRGRFNFFDKVPHRIHAGPIHIAPEGGTESWEFSFEIPSRMSPQAVLSELEKPERSSFVPLTGKAIESYSLPSSFFTKGRDRKKKQGDFECYIEYHLEASLVLQGSHGKSITATLPIEVRAPPMPYPFASFDLTSQPQLSSINTFRLVPGIDDHLTLKQKTQKFFHSSKVPSLGVMLQVDTPATIQLGNPAPVPVQVRIVPDRTRTSDAIHDVPQTALLTSLELIVKARTYVMAYGADYKTTYEMNDTTKHRIHLPFDAITTGPVVGNLNEPKEDLQSPPPYDEKSLKTQNPQDTKARLPTPTTEDRKSASETSKVTEISAPDSPTTDTSSIVGESSSRGACGSNNHAIQSSGSKALLLPINWGSDLPNSAPLDVGTLMDLHIFSTHFSVLGNRSITTADGGIYPDFTSFCIKHEHFLKWKMVLEIAGETVKFEAEHPLSVLGPSA